MEEDFITEPKQLSPSEIEKLQTQNTRLVSALKAKQLEADAKKHWDLFYKRNEARFFKDRYWTTREFEELLDSDEPSEIKVIFEIGCGVGNFIFPLIKEGLNFKVIACDLSPRAVEFVKMHEAYDPDRIKVFQADFTTKAVFDAIDENSVDIATLIFVLSAIHPEKFSVVLSNIYKLLKPNGLLLFRDYGLYDMAQIRFKPGHKIAENFYMRQDGTRSYYFSTAFAEKLFKDAGFEVLCNTYVHRRTINKKENIDVPRIFIQGKFKKSI